jgi:hypothetical protein
MKTMKKYKEYMLITGLVLFISSVNAQTINWAGLKEGNKHIIYAGFGMEYGVTYELGYGHQFRTGLFPIIAGLEYSFPSGSNILSDFKTKIGGQIRLIEYHGFQFSTKIYGVFRRYGNEFDRLVNFGSDMAGIVGYYRPHFFVAGEAGFDKAIVTHFKHSEEYKDQYPDVVDGWYEPATGGNFYYGLQAGFSFWNQDIWLRAGKILTQDFKTTPLIPIYGQLGLNIKF